MSEEKLNAKETTNNKGKSSLYKFLFFLLLIFFVLDFIYPKFEKYIPYKYQSYLNIFTNVALSTNQNDMAYPDFEQKIKELEKKLEEARIDISENTQKISEKSLKTQKNLNEDLIKERLVVLELSKEKTRAKIDEILVLEKENINELKQKISLMEKAKADLNEVVSISKKISKNEKNIEIIGAKTDDKIIKLLVLTKIQKAIMLGDSFSDNYELLEKLFEKNIDDIKQVKKIKKYSKTGIPTIIKLQKEFSKIAAIAEWESHDVNIDGWLGKTIKELKKLVVIRKIGQENKQEKTVANYISSAESFLKKNDLKNAVLELEKIKNKKSNEILQNWKIKAKARIEADEVLSKTTDKILKIIGKSHLKGE
jgi:hypothetical protein